MGKNTEILLGVNIDHVATLRQVRGTSYPSLLDAAREAELHGADGITIHLREDRRHIQDADVSCLRENIGSRLNLEMAVTEEMLGIALQIKPEYCCLVPEKREELTTEGGLDVLAQKNRVREVVSELAQEGIQCSLFIDPEVKQIDAALSVDAPIVEIHTGAYADSTSKEGRNSELRRVSNAVKYAHKNGLQVNAGHGLNYENVGPVATLREITELNIGHAIVCQAIFTGIGEAVREMKQLMIEARRA